MGLFLPAARARFDLSRLLPSGRTVGQLFDSEPLVRCDQRDSRELAILALAAETAEDWQMESALLVLRLVAEQLLKPVR